MSRPIVFMVPGQGVQYPGMLGGLYARNGEFRHQLDCLLREAPTPLAERLLAIIKNEASVRACELEDCRLTHPLVFAVHYALAETLRIKGIKPDYVLGYSLGELTASAINGSLPIKTALKLAIETGAWVAEHTPERRMMAILASPNIQQDYYPYFESITVTCLNYAGHFVITGTSHELEAIAGELRSEGVHHELLPINRGFHSSAMDPFKLQAAKWSQSIEWRPPRAPLISCALAKVCPPSVLQDNHLGTIHRQPVRFAETFRRVEEEWAPRFIDLSATGTLAAFARQLISPSRRSAIHTVHSRLGKGEQHFETFLARWTSPSP